MRFQLDITMTEQDYLAYNCFHSLESRTGKKLLRKSRITFVAVVAVLGVLYVLMTGWTAFTILYIFLLTLFSLIYLLLFKKVMQHSIKSQIKKLKKVGKLPFDPATKYEFYEDHMVEICPSTRTERGYDALDRVCIVPDRFILLYTSTVGAYILPIAQLSQQVDLEAFLGFLSEKCKTMEHY